MRLYRGVRPSSVLPLTLNYTQSSRGVCVPSPRSGPSTEGFDPPLSVGGQDDGCEIHTLCLFFQNTKHFRSQTTFFFSESVLNASLPSPSQPVSTHYYSAAMTTENYSVLTTPSIRRSWRGGEGADHNLIIHREGMRTTTLYPLPPSAEEEKVPIIGEEEKLPIITSSSTEKE